MRTLCMGAAVMVLACGPAPKPQPTAVPIAPAGSVEPEPEPREEPKIPAPFHGTYVAAGDTSVTIVEVGPEGVVQTREHAAIAEAVNGMVLSPDTRHVVFSVYRHRASPSGALIAMSTESGATREITTCPYACRLGGIDADGQVWFVKVDGTHGIGPVARIPLEGGAATDLPLDYADCVVKPRLSPDGTRVVIAVDNGGGWPICVQGGHQGFWVATPADAAKGQLRRFGCFTNEPPAAINLGIGELRFVADGRLLVQAIDHWTDPDRDPSAPFPWWSCAIGSSSARRSDNTLVPALLEIDGKDWIVAVRANISVSHDRSYAKPLRIAGPFDADELAFHPDKR